jgi:hypothetical protein
MLTYIAEWPREETHYSLAASSSAGTAQKAIAQNWRADGGTVPASGRGIFETPEVGGHKNGPADCYKQPTSPNQSYL